MDKVVCMVDMVNKMDNVDDMNMENMLERIGQDCPESNRSDGTQLEEEYFFPDFKKAHVFEVMKSAAPNQTVKFVHFFGGYLAALEPCCLAGHFAYNKPQFKDNFLMLGSSRFFLLLVSMHTNLTFKHTCPGKPQFLRFSLFDHVWPISKYFIPEIQTSLYGYQYGQ